MPRVYSHKFAKPWPRIHQVILVAKQPRKEMQKVLLQALGQVTVLRTQLLNTGRASSYAPWVLQGKKMLTALQESSHAGNFIVLNKQAEYTPGISYTSTFYSQSQACLCVKRISGNSACLSKTIKVSSDWTWSKTHSFLDLPHMTGKETITCSPHISSNRYFYARSSNSELWNLLLCLCGKGYSGTGGWCSAYGLHRPTFSNC